MAMEGTTIILKLKDGVNLFVYKSILVEDSQKFRKLIDEMHQSELEFDDFAPNSVTLFIAFLEDKRLGEIENTQFREMNKLANVFEVGWMKKDCRTWMEGRIECVNTDDEKVFIFEECLYIIKRWPDKALMESFVSRLVQQDNSSFVSQNLMQIDTLDTLKLDHILMVGGCNPEPFLRSIITNLEGQRVLSQNIKHLLGSMNLAMCFELHEQLYLEVFDKIRNLSDISTEDVKFVLQLATETTTSVSSRREERKKKTTLLYNRNEYAEILANSKTLSDVETALIAGQVTSLYMVVELLLNVYYIDNSITENSESRFITTLENICGERKRNKISKQHLETIINALNCSPLPQKDKLITLLNDIKNNDKLSTCHEIIQINSDNGSDVTPAGTWILGQVKHFLTGDDSAPAGTVWKLHYTFRHPFIRECQEPGKCGFITLHRIQDDGNWIMELCTESKYYTGTGLHVHDIVSTNDMYLYGTWSGTSGSTEPDNKIRVAGRTWWGHCLPNVTDWVFEQFCIDYDVSDYIVFKRREG